MRLCLLTCLAGAFLMSSVLALDAQTLLMVEQGLFKILRSRS